VLTLLVAAVVLLWIRQLTRHRTTGAEPVPVTPRDERVSASRPE
jgi:hypothetical protein